MRGRRGGWGWRGKQRSRLQEGVLEACKGCITGVQDRNAGKGWRENGRSKIKPPLVMRERGRGEQ